MSFLKGWAEKMMRALTKRTDKPAPLPTPRAKYGGPKSYAVRCSVKWCDGLVQVSKAEAPYCKNAVCSRHGTFTRPGQKVRRDRQRKKALKEQARLLNKRLQEEHGHSPTCGTRFDGGGCTCSKLLETIHDE